MGKEESQTLLGKHEESQALLAEEEALLMPPMTWRSRLFGISRQTLIYCAVCALLALQNSSCVRPLPLRAPLRPHAALYGN